MISTWAPSAGESAAKKTADGGGSATPAAAVFQGVTAGGHIIVQFGLTAAPTTFRGLVRRFLRSYLGTPEAPVPFGGRDAEIAELNRWLADPDAPANLLVTAPAGRGKTALLVHWLNQVDHEVWPVAFLPISIRFGTNRPEIFYEALAARLAEILGERPPPAPADPTSFYQDKVIQYLDMFCERDRRCLVVIDGLDEAAGWRVDTSVLPLDPASQLRIVASARLLAGDRGAADWLRRLGWNVGHTLARTLEMPILDRDGIADVISKMGDPLAPLSGRVDIITELLRLVQGEPLLIELYVRALLERGDQPIHLRADDLRTLQPGFAGFFKTWWEHQRQAWRNAPTAVDEQTIDAILVVLACALGPLRLTELADLIREIHGVDRIVSADSMYPIRRFVIGDGVEVGYSFGHPKLADYFRDEHFGAGEVIHRTRAGFVEWGRKTVRALNEGLRPATERPSYEYLLNYYTQHLEQQKGTPPQLYRELVEDGWRRAWEAYEGSFQGFSRDVELAWHRLRDAAKQDPERLKEPAVGLGGQVRCVLCLSAVRSIGTNVPAVVLAELVRHDLLSPKQALHLAQLKEDRDGSALVVHGCDRGSALAALAPRLPPDLLAEALIAARTVRNRDARAEALAALASYVPGAERHAILAEALGAAREAETDWGCARAVQTLAPHLSTDLLNEALSAARAIEMGAPRAHAVQALAPHLSATARPAILAEALAAACAANTKGGLEALGMAGPTDWDRAHSLAALAPHLPPDLLREALAAARTVRGGKERVEALAALAPHLPPAERRAVCDEALAAARAIEKDALLGLLDRTRAFAALLPHLPAAQRRTVLDEALAAARAIKTVWDRAAALRALASHLPPDFFAEALAAARAAWDEQDRRSKWYGRNRDIAALAPYLPPNLLAEALDAARGVKDGVERAAVLAALVPHLPAAEHSSVLLEAYRAARVIADDGARAQALAALAPHLPAAKRFATIADALSALATGRAPRFGNRAVIFTELGPHVPPELLDDAVATARTISTDWERAPALAALLPRLPAAMRGDVLGEALTSARAAEDGWWRAAALAALAPHLPAAVRRDTVTETLAMARATEGGATRAHLLVALMPHLPASARPAVLAEALAAACAAETDWDRARALAVLAPLLAEAARPRSASILFWGALLDLGARRSHTRFLGLEEALAVARAIKTYRDRAHALAALAPHLPAATRNDVLAEALDAIRTETACGGHAVVFEGGLRSLLAPHDLRRAVDDFLQFCANEPRERALSSLAAMESSTSFLSFLPTSTPVRATASILGQLGGEGAIVETVDAIRDVSRWWP